MSEDIKLNSKKLKQKLDDIIEKSKKNNQIKPLSHAFKTTPCEKEEHKGDKKSFKK